MLYLYIYIYSYLIIYRYNYIHTHTISLAHPVHASRWAGGHAHAHAYTRTHTHAHAHAHALDTMCHRSQVSSRNQPAKSVTHFTLEVLLQCSQDMQLHKQVQGTGQVPLPIHNRSFVAHGRL